MDDSFLGLVPTDDPFRWQLPVTEGVTGGRGFLFGGCYLAAALTAMERTTGRPAVWATTQFILTVGAGDLLDLCCDVTAEGRSLTQGRVVAACGSEHHSTTLMALGRRTLVDRVDPTPVPAANQRGAGVPVELDSAEQGLRQRIEIYSADDSAQLTGRKRLLWFRFPGLKVGDSTSVAIAADFLPPTFSGLLGHPAYGASLDNTIRFFGRAEAEWLLVETSVDGLAGGIGHGTTRVWGEDGQLLAIGTQTCAVSDFEP